jgi:hypothetical protein
MGVYEELKLVRAGGNGRPRLSGLDRTYEELKPAVGVGFQECTFFRLDRTYEELKPALLTGRLMPTQLSVWNVPMRN